MFMILLLVFVVVVVGVTFCHCGFTIVVDPFYVVVVNKCSFVEFLWDGGGAQGAKIKVHSTLIK